MATHDPTVPLAPELLAPAGDWDCVRAAIENGADAIYFGLDSGFNARARAKNFGVGDLPDLMRLLHRRGLRGYVTFNTLVFPSELPRAAEALRHISGAGVDAVLVQDLGIARLAREMCPELEVHASTQMTLTSGECIEVARQLGIRRAVLPRELSIAEIRKVRAATDLPLEVFVHGALCVAYSGQCLTSESLGGRSANRGQCAQACRLPYELIVDGQDRDLGDVKYLLSPQDLAAYELIPELIDAGVCSLKIEGRLKTPEYVANITQHYRQAIDQAVANGKVSLTPTDVREMELSFSRGFSPGWLQGCDHKMLVPGDNSAKRGVHLGEVVDVEGNRVTVQLSAPVSRGDGVAFSGDRSRGTDWGGRVYQLLKRGQVIASGTASSGVVELVFGGQRGESPHVHIGQQVWKTDDPQLNKRLRSTYHGADPVRRTPLGITLHAEAGKPLRLTATSASGAAVEIESDAPLELARRHPATEESLRDQFDRLGGTPFRLEQFSATIVGDPMVPHSVTGVLRRNLIDEMIAAVESMTPRVVNETALAELCKQVEQHSTANAPAAPTLWALCRTPAQLSAALDAGVRHVYAEYHDLGDYKTAVEQARAANAIVYLSTLRIQKPGELGLAKKLAKYSPDGVLVRNLAALRACRELELTCIADFSLNAANQLTADWLRQQGASRVTISYDLNRDQVSDLITAVPGQWLEAVIHQHMPMFHMEHCVFCSVISPGTNKTNCGRPCDRHDVKLRDRVGMEHPLLADVGCRNTLFNATPQSAAEVVPDLLAAHVSNYRIEFLADDPARVRRVIGLYQHLLSGGIEAEVVWRELKADNRVGITRGTLEQRRDPLAII